MNTKGGLRLLLTMQPPEGAQFVAEDRMRAGCALLDPADVQGGCSEVDLLYELRQCKLNLPDLKSRTVAFKPTSAGHRADFERERDTVTAYPDYSGMRTFLPDYPGMHAAF